MSSTRVGNKPVVSQDGNIPYSSAEAYAQAQILEAHAEAQAQAHQEKLLAEASVRAQLHAHQERLIAKNQNRQKSQSRIIVEPILPPPQPLQVSQPSPDFITKLRNVDMKQELHRFQGNVEDVFVRECQFFFNQHFDSSVNLLLEEGHSRSIRSRRGFIDFLKQTSNYISCFSNLVLPSSLLLSQIYEHKRISNLKDRLEIHSNHLNQITQLANSTNIIHTALLKNIEGLIKG